MVVVARINVQGVTALCKQLGNGAQVARGLLDGDDALVLCQLLVNGKRDVATRTGGNVVKNDGLVGLLGRFQKVLDQALRGSLVVVGGDQQQRIRSYLARVFRKLNAVSGIVRAGTGNNGNATCDLFDDKANALAMLS